MAFGGMGDPGSRLLGLQQMVKGSGLPGGILPYTPPSGVTPRIMGQGEVMGFAASTAEQTAIVGLPTGIVVPGEVEAWIVAARRVDAWIDKGRQACAWATERGVAEASWVDPETDELRLPDELAGEAVPGFVAAWLAEAPDIEAILEVLAVS